MREISQGPKCTSQIWKSAVIGLRFFPLKSADVRGAGTRDEPLRTSAWEANTGDQGTYRNLRKIMALPLLPTIEITPMFMWLKRHVRTKPLQQLVDYIERT